MLALTNVLPVALVVKLDKAVVPPTAPANSTSSLLLIERSWPPLMVPDNFRALELVLAMVEAAAKVIFPANVLFPAVFNSAPVETPLPEIVRGSALKRIPEMPPLSAS